VEGGAGVDSGHWGFWHANFLDRWKELCVQLLQNS
jgi:hypothetical protein